ncbi:AMIN domain-containing protein [Lusitaniella coriacea LEGE 07157]|uniref:AMIN domain-containing protein n=1 Tax=Lusitaniella coriacea LEGE 07157 TaxID=945747 RepID=A0A8J7IVK7_9CYAN|nr:AMIN domain-containing protein [Lusitaniella coriacea]MBE9117343.1 AMIN domain-containing protein [Lusitaniella coriacea LEGE 07157]
MRKRRKPEQQQQRVRLQQKIIPAIALLALPALFSQNLQAETLENWKFDPNTNQLELWLSASVTPLYYVETNPPRIIIDLPNTTVATLPPPQNYPNNLSRITLSNSGTGNSRIVLELSPNAMLSPQQVQLQKQQSNAGVTYWVLRPSILSQPRNVATPAPSNSAPVTVTVPPLDRATTPPNPPPQTPVPSRDAKTPVIEFGQPLPKTQVK